MEIDEEMDNAITFNGVWIIPDEYGNPQRFSGTLSYFDDRDSVLELIHEPNSGAVRLNYYYDAICGTDARMQKYTLLGASLIHNDVYTRFEFVIRFVLIGDHVKSLNDTCFDACLVRFPYLNRWALDSRFSVNKAQNLTHVILDLRNHSPFFSVDMEDGLDVSLYGQLTDNISRYSITATQATYLMIKSSNPISINKYLSIIAEFSQFLSIALFSEQHPTEVIFTRNSVRIDYPMLFRKKTSVEPWVLPLIKFDDLSERMHSVLLRWHSSYIQINPICNYLIRSIQYNTSFDAPDFLIVAQALDGYFKRFVNNKNGKDIKQYQRQVEILLNAFKEVDVIKKCKLDPSVLTQTRHKYSHLIPDGDKKISKAVAGEELYWLTQKCIVLLTCCILDTLGLTKDEINLCCNDSPIQQIVSSFPLWLE